MWSETKVLQPLNFVSNDKTILPNADDGIKRSCSCSCSTYGYAAKNTGK